MKKTAIVDSVIVKGDDNKYYEQIDGQLIEVDCDVQFPQSWQLCRLSFLCQLIDGEKRTGKQICLDAKYLRGKSIGTQLDQGKFVSKGDNIILVDGENSGEVFTVPYIRTNPNDVLRADRDSFSTRELIDIQNITSRSICRNDEILRFHVTKVVNFSLY